jgi:hypothetical protein
MIIRSERLSILFMISFILISCGNHEERNKKVKSQIPVTANLGASGIVFITEMHNFGNLKAGEIVSFSFVFMNNGSKPLAIKKVDSSCGCIKAKFDNNEIGRGEKSAIEVIFNTSGEWGNQLKIIEVETSSGVKKELKISAYIENDQFNNLLNKQQ